MDAKKTKCIEALSKVDKRMLDLLQSHRVEMNKQEKDCIMDEIIKLQKIQVQLTKQLQKKHLN